jgi:hypothetical protein
MKYLLSILVMTLVMVPFMLFYIMKGLWEFNFDETKEMWNDYTDLATQKYRKAFGIKRPTRF